MIASIIHDPARTDRDPYVAEACHQLPGLRIVTPVPDRTPILSCHKTHRLLWTEGHAAAAPDEMISVFEDDIQFTPAWTTDFWYKCEAWLAQSNFDLLLGGVSHAGYPTLMTDHVFTAMVELKTFTATHCYLLKPSAVPLLLRVPESKHADAALSSASLRIATAVPFVAMQWPGRSDIRHMTVNDSKRFVEVEGRLKRQLGLRP